MKRHYYIIKGIVLLAAMLLAACSSSDSDDSPIATSQNEIHLTTNVTSMPLGTRTTTYDDAGLKSEGSFTCVAYEANTTTPYISATTVDWNSTNSRWEFNGGASHYYWPIPSSNVDTWRSLDFFAYVPSAANLATDAPYITTGPTYSAPTTPSVSHTVTFSCDMANTATKEFMFGMALGLNGGNVPETGVPLQFLHPFARIRFKLSDASGTSVKINSITLGGDYYKTADYSYDGSTSTWSNPAGAGAFGPCQLNTDYLVIPSNYGSRTLTVNATWDEWSAVTRDISTTVDFDWASPGYSYTYVLTLNKYVLIVNSEKYTEQW